MKGPLTSGNGEGSCEGERERGAQHAAAGGEERVSFSPSFFVPRVQSSKVRDPN